MSEEWEQRCIAMKKNYDDLVKVRKTAVLNDIKDLQMKIDEHRNVNAQNMTRLEDFFENANDKKLNKERMIHEIGKLERSIERLQKQLSAYDDILEILIEYSDLKVTAHNDIYYVSYDHVENGPKIAIKKNEGVLLYSPKSGISKDAPPILLTKTKIDKNGLRQRCEALIEYSQIAALM